MSPLAARVARFIRSRSLVGPGDRLVVALSGGPDSVTLLHALLECAPTLGAVVVGVGHLHHGLRGVEADEDESFCRELAAACGLRIYVERLDVAALARQAGTSTEAAGHDARAVFFERARVALDGTLIATGHTRNDQAESVLLHVARGAGLHGLTGIRPGAGKVVRPLLDVERREIERYLEDRALPSRQDSSNRDVGIPRNRVRHEVLPSLGAAVPGVVAALGRLATIAGDEDVLMAELARSRAAAVTRCASGGWVAGLRDLAGEPASLRRRIIAAALAEGSQGRAVGLAHVEAVLALAARARAGSRLSLPGQTAEIRGGDLVLTPRALGPVGGLSGVAGTGARQIPVPGVLLDEDAGWELTVDLGPAMDAEAARQVAGSGTRAVVDAEEVGSKLFVRHRRPGDRIRPLGMRGHRKLQDIFVDAKVPRQHRDSVPVVVDARDRIVWVVGHGVSAEACVTGRPTGVLLLGFRRLGGLG